MEQFWPKSEQEKWKDAFFSSEDLWRYLLTESLKRYFVKFFWNLVCLLSVLRLLPTEGIDLFHPYMVKMWVLATTACLLTLIYFFYYFGDGNSQHTIWSIGRMKSVRQAWGGAGMALVLFRGSILIDILLHSHARIQSPLIILLDISQFLLWTSVVFPIPITVTFCVIEFCIQLVRLWTSGIEMHMQFRIIGTFIIILYSITSIVVAKSVLTTVQKAYETLHGIQTISDSKLRMVHLLCSVILFPIHTISVSIRSIDSNLVPFKAWNNRILCATNQVVLYSNNFLMLVRIEEGRFQFEATNTMHIRKVVDTVISRLPILGDTGSSNDSTPVLNTIIDNATDDTVVVSDLKAVTFILENCLTYCLNATRRKLVELKGRLRRQVQFNEFHPIKITMEIIPCNGEEASDSVDSQYFMQFIITFGVLTASNTYLVETLIDNCIQSMNYNTNFKTEFDVCVQSALDEIKRPRYLHERLSTSSDNIQTDPVNNNNNNNNNHNNNPSFPERPQPSQPTRQSTILMTAKQMLDSCGGSLKLLEIGIPHSKAYDLKSGNDVNVLILRIPCQYRMDLAPKYDEVTGNLRFEQVRGNFDFGILVTDNELSEYAQRMFLECGVKCCRITSNSQLSLDNYTAIITDSLATYANVRVKGFRGKVVVMSAAAIYIDGNTSIRSCDYVLPVPCQLTDVQALIQSLYLNDDIRPPNSGILDLLSLFARIEETLRSYSSIPFIYFITQIIGVMKSFFVSLAELIQEVIHWLQIRDQDRLDKEREKNEIYQLGKQYDMVSRWFSRSFKTDIESDYLKWRIFHTPPFWKDAPHTLEVDQTSSIPASFRGDYAPSEQIVEKKYVSPACLFYLLVHSVLALIMIALYPTNIRYLIPFIAFIPLVGTIYIFNFKWFRKWKGSHIFWDCVQIAVILSYGTIVCFFFFGPRPPLHNENSFREEERFEKLLTLPVGQFKLGQILCFVTFAPLLAKTISLASFTRHKIVKIVLGIVTITSLVICIPKFFAGRQCLIAFILLLPSFPLLHFTTISQCWMRKWYQNTQKYHFSHEFLAKCTEIVWKELRYPLKTLIDYHEEYLSFTAKYICASELGSVSHSLLQQLTTFKLGNLLLMEIQTVLKLKESLDSGLVTSSEHNKPRVLVDLRHELINIGRVFESETPITIKVYFRMEHLSIPRFVHIDKDLLLAVLVNSFSQSITCIKSKVNADSRSISFIHEIVVTLSTTIIKNSLFLKFEVMDSGSPLSTTENKNTIFQEDLCRQYITALNGLFDRVTCYHSVYRNIVTFSLPITVSQPTLWRGSFHESGWKHHLTLEKYLARNNHSLAPVSRYRSKLGKQILLLVSDQSDSQLISRAFRLQKWECYEVKSYSQLNSSYLKPNSEIDLDVVLIDNGFFTDDDQRTSIFPKFRSVYDNLCIVGFVNNRSAVRESDKGYDLIISRPLTNGDLLKIFQTCDAIAIRSLLWLK